MSFLWKQKVLRQHRTILDIYAICSALKLKQCENTLEPWALKGWAKACKIRHFYVFLLNSNVSRTSANEVIQFFIQTGGRQNHCVKKSAALCLWEASELIALKAMIWQVHAVRAHWLLCGVADWLLRLCLNRSRASRYDSERRAHAAERW